ncbi:hypothetical protein LCGC14_1180700 [marine sediment metagenome]|uniref:P22 coat protein-protein 5 domain protein n=1 Tax=marine sediment metagenome TaxID=412755 RepID=A0A0F9LS13_9ZZZZ
MTVNAFKPILWSASILERLQEAHVYGNVVNRDYEGEIKQHGDTVRVNSVGPVTVDDYTINTTNLTPQVLHTAGQPMVIDQIKKFYFAIDDVDKAQIKGGVMDEAMEEAAFALSNTSDDFLATTLAASVATANILESGAKDSSTSNPIITGLSSGDAEAYNLLVDLSTRLNKANVKAKDRWIVVDPEFIGLLLKDQKFVGFATSGSADTIKTGAPGAGAVGGGLGGMLKTLTGFNVHVSNSVPVSSSVLTILAGSKMACSFAEQIPEGQPEAYRLQTGFLDAVRGLHVYGAKVFRPAALAAAYVKYS